MATDMLECSLYRLYGNRGQLLYAGIADDVEARLKHHAATKLWWRQVVRVEVMILPSRAHAEWAEWAVITTCRPTYNKKAPLPGVPDPDVMEALADLAEELVPLTPGEQRVMSVLAGGPAKAGVIAKASGLSESGVHLILGQLVQRELVEQPQRYGPYRVVTCHASLQ